MKPLPKKYDHQITEKKWQDHWLESKTYQWDETVKRDDSFVIDTPPPTVSGLLHMGHVFSYTQADFVARYQRMCGKNVFYPMGFDDNGLPTERLVEKVRKIRASDMSRQEFIAICKEVVTEAEEEFRHLFRSIALSVDWDQEYQTINDDCRKLSQLSFLDLFKKDKVYRKLQPMLWDPVDRTALAQAEIEDQEFSSKMTDIRFASEDGDEVVIATTRPELLASCVAVFYHPEDSRYEHLKGKTAVTALFGVRVPLLADEKVEIEKGTGLVMCCTFGDETDIDWWRGHSLDTRVSLDEYGKIRYIIDQDKQTIAFQGDETEGALNAQNVVDIAKTIGFCEQLNGKKAKAARAEILTLLEAEGLIVKQTDITHAVKCAERSGAPLEIRPTHQWFIKILDQKEALLKKAAECEWHPHHMKIRMDQWIEGLSWDWCISRQRYFGVPFPIWYSKRAGEEGKILVASPDQMPVDPMVDLPEGYSKDEVEPEMDVMDTWATSSVSPQLSSKGITEEYAIDQARHKSLFPADLRPQAHEIIRTWAFYTIVKAHLHEDTIPWKNLMISGWCLAADKTKMSKSKGNVVTPTAMIEEKGSDVVRFWASTSRLGSDTAYSEDVLKIGKKLVNKLWNATKFAAMHLDKLTVTPQTAALDVKAGIINEQLDLWILSRLNVAVAKATEEFERFEYCNARVAVEDFFWNDFCDNYLELVKVRVYGEAENASKEGQQSAVYTIYHCLDGILRLFAPIVPHICEELYSHIFVEKYAAYGDTLHQAGCWPQQEDYPQDQEAVAAGTACISILDVVRRMKATRNVSLKWPLNFIAITHSDNGNAIGDLENDLKNVTNANEISWQEKQAPEALTQKTEDGRFTITTEFAENN